MKTIVYRWADWTRFIRRNMPKSWADAGRLARREVSRG